MFEDSPIKRKNEFVQGPCPVCGGTDFEQGTVIQARYRSNTNMWNTTGFGKVIGVRRCLTCNSLYPYVDEDMTRKQNRMAGLALALILGVVLLILFTSFFLAAGAP